MSLGGAEANNENDDSVSAIDNDALELEQPPCFIGRQFEHGWSLFTHAHDLQRANFPLHEQHFLRLTDPDIQFFPLSYGHRRDIIILFIKNMYFLFYQ